MTLFSTRRRVHPRVLVSLAIFTSALGAITPSVWGQGAERRRSGTGGALSAEALRLLAEAAQLHEEALGLWRENPEEALPRAEKVLEIRRKVLGTEHRDYAASLDTAARICKLLGDFPRAKSLYEQALSIRKRTLGAEHPDYLASLKSLAGLHYLLEDYERAKTFFEEASRIEKRLAILDDIGKPAAWMAIRSYAAIDDALAELSRLEGGATNSEDLSGLLKKKIGSLKGLDRKRPIGISLPVVGETKMLGIVLSIPYSDREKIVEAMTHFFPVLNEQDGLLRFQGGPVPIFGRVDERDALLLLSTVPDLLPSPHGRIPVDLFTTASGPSVVLHLDFEAALSLRASPLKDLEYRGLNQLQRFGVRLAGGDSYHEDLFRQAFSEWARRLIDRLLVDFTTGDVRLWLSGEWRCDLEVRARSGSATAAFLAAQDPSRLRLPALSSPDRLGGMQVGIRLTEGLRKEAERWLTSVRKWAETHPPPMEDGTAASHDARVKVAPKLLSICEQLFTEETIESGCDVTASGGKPSLVFWVRGAKCGPDVLELSDLVHRGSPSPGGARGLVPRFDRHGRTPIHLIRAEGSADDERVYVAAEDHFLLVCLGRSAQPLKTILDLTREQGPSLPPDSPRRALLEMDLSFANVSRAGFSEISGNERPVVAAFRDSVLRGPDTPLTASLLATKTGFTLGARWPEPFLPALAAMLRASLASSAGLSSGSNEDG